MTIEEFVAAIETFCTNHTVEGSTPSGAFIDFILKNFEKSEGSRNNVALTLKSLGYLSPDRSTVYRRIDVESGIAMHPVTGGPRP